jgi:hypothetical protein
MKNVPSVSDNVPHVSIIYIKLINGYYPQTVNLGFLFLEEVMLHNDGYDDVIIACKKNNVGAVYFIL